MKKITLWSKLIKYFEKQGTQNKNSLPDSWISLGEHFEWYSCGGMADG